MNKIYKVHESFKVFLGTLRFLGNDPNKQTIPMLKIFVHPLHDNYTKINDIALIQLAKPAILNEYVSTVCLPSKQYNFNGKPLVATGWGRTSKTDVSLGSDRLNETTLFAECGPKEIVRDTQICAINLTGGVSGGPTNVCQGDSGGPLVMQDGENWILVGLMSFGVAPACDNQASFFTNVYSYLEWILQTMKDNS